MERWPAFARVALANVSAAAKKSIRSAWKRCHGLAIALNARKNLSRECWRKLRGKKLEKLENAAKAFGGVLHLRRSSSQAAPGWPSGSSSRFELKWQLPQPLPGSREDCIRHGRRGGRQSRFSHASGFLLAAHQMNFDRGS